MTAFFPFQYDLLERPLHVRCQKQDEKNSTIQEENKEKLLSEVLSLLRSGNPNEHQILSNGETLAEYAVYRVLQLCQQRKKKQKTMAKEASKAKET
jgi:hypothetical protein